MIATMLLGFVRNAARLTVTLGDMAMCAA